MLRLNQVSLSFGGLKAVQDVCLDLFPGDLHGLIGPNGAGKTTIFNLVTGVYHPQAGRIELHGRTINGLRPHRVAHAGIARTFQNIRLFPDLSVLDNVRVACHLRARHGIAAALLRTARHRGEERAVTDHSLDLLHKFNLDSRRHETARNLPYGDQRRLEIARALATGPAVLLLDEPAAGMNTGEKRALAELIRQIRQEFNLTILLIDHDMGLIMNICDRITVLDHGEVICCGTASQVQSDPQVIEAYLGESSKTTDHPNP
ncbi:MAG: ABC transporter ATP-binding protein [Phycisphaeraceae bacterium]|nr:ABC transporter ATP-binding protein [Phycisphaeraceae bacterium]